MKGKQEKQVGIVPEKEYDKWVAKQKVQTLLQKIKGKDTEGSKEIESFESLYGYTSGSSIEDPPTSFSDISEQDVHNN